MKARIFGRHLSRGGGARKALFRSIISALVLNGKIKTTKAKAKAVQPDIDRLIAIAKKDTIAARRILSSYFAGDRKVVFEITESIAPSLKAFSGGVTRLIPLPPRMGDAAKMVRMQWVAEIVKGAPKPKAAKKLRKSVRKPVKKTKTTKVAKELKSKAIKKK